MFVLQSVLIKRVNFKGSVWSGTKKTVVIKSVCIKWVSVKRGFTVSTLPTTCTINTVVNNTFVNIRTIFIKISHNG